MTDTPDDTTVTRLPVRFREPPPTDRVLLGPYEIPLGDSTCSHTFVQYMVDPSLAEVVCGKCKARLNPMWVLEQLARADRRHAESQKAAREAQKRLDERSRTKCQHCNKMTRISRR